MPISNLPDGYVEIQYDYIIAETSKESKVEGAILIWPQDEWIPKSCIDDMFEDGEGKTMVVTECIAKEKGLI